MYVYLEHWKNGKMTILLRVTLAHRERGDARPCLFLTDRRPALPKRIFNACVLARGYAMRVLVLDFNFRDIARALARSNRCGGYGKKNSRTLPTDIL